VKRLALLSAVAAFTLAGGMVAAADDVADFYEDKTVVVIAPSGTGGSIYQYALLVSNHIGKHIPGEPTVVVEARSGGSGIKASNYIFNAASDEGLVIAELHPSSLIVPLTQDADFDFSKVNWLGSVAVRPYVGVVWESVAANTIEKMRETPVIFASSGVGGSSYQYPRFIAEMTGAKLNIIPGYKSGGEMNLAMERGEVEGRGNYYEGFLATNPDWIENNKLHYVFRMGDDHPDLMDVPLASSYAETDEHKKMLGLLEAPLKIGQGFYVHENVPQDRVTALRQAFADMLADPEFQAEAETLNLVVRPKSAEDVAAIVKETYATPKETADKLNALFKK